MKDLANLIKMYYYSVYAIRKSIGVIIVLSIVMSFWDTSLIPFSAALIVMGMTYSSAAYEDKNKMNYLIYSLPVEPKRFVLSKYIYGFINTIISLVISNILFLIIKNLSRGNTIDFGIVFINSSVIFIGTVITILVVPLALIIGFEKGRFIIVFLAILPMCITNSVSNSIKLPVINISTSMVILMAALILITLTLISYFITSNLYAKKEI